MNSTLLDSSFAQLIASFLKPTPLKIISAISADGRLHMIDAESGTVAFSTFVRGRPVFRMACSPSGAIVIGCRDQLQLFKVDSFDAVVRSVGAITRIRGATAIAFSPDGQSVAVGCEVPTAVAVHDRRIHDEYDRAVALLAELGDSIPSVALTPFNRRNFYIVQVESFATAVEMHIRSAARCIAHAPCGQIIAIGHAHGLEIIQPASRPVIRRRLATDHVERVAFSPCGQKVAAVDDIGNAVLIDLHTGNRISVVPLPGGIKSLYFQPGGQIVEASCYNGSRYNGSHLVMVDTSVGVIVRSIALSPVNAPWRRCVHALDRNTIAVGCVDGCVYKFDANTGEIIHNVKLGTRCVTGVAYLH